MPENLKIGAFVFGAVLVLIALLGGNFKLFGAEVAATTSNRFLRLVAFALGATFLVVAIHSPTSEISVVPTPSSPQPTQSSSSSPSLQATQPSPTPTIPSPGSPQNNSPSACVLTIGNSLVPLMSKPKRFSQELVKVKPGNYTSLNYVTTDFGGFKEEGWFQIESEERQGWIVNDTWTIDSKSHECP
jgi:hypothetical protein